MKPDNTPPYDPLRNDPPGLGPAPVRHDISQDISGLRSTEWQSHPRRRTRWPLWLGGLAVLGVVAAMMLDMKPEQWVSAHLDRPAPAAESVPMPLPSEPAPQAQTDVPPLPPLAQAPADATAPAATNPAAPANAEPARSRNDSRKVAQAALQPPADAPVVPATPTPVPEPAMTETPPVPADPKPAPVEPTAPTPPTGQ
jgi:hypothetical protein